MVQELSIDTHPGEVEKLLHHPAKSKMLKVQSLNVDRRYQRDLLTAKVRKMARNFDPLQLTPLIVNTREDGTFWVIDGQQRRAVLSELGIAHAPCHVYDRLTYMQEAALFVHLNRNTTKVHPVDMFRGAVEAKDPVALQIQKILEKFQIKVMKGRGPRKLGAINAAISIYTEPALEKYKRSGPEALGACLNVLVNAWTSEDMMLRGDFIQGLGYFLLHYDERELPLDSLTDKVRVTDPGDVLRVASSAKQFARGGGSGSRMPYALAFFSVYNKGRRTRHLEERIG